MSTPPKHTILSMVSYLQELKTIILEKSVFPVIAFCFFEDVSSKTSSLRFNVLFEGKRYAFPLETTSKPRKMKNDNQNYLFTSKAHDYRE